MAINLRDIIRNWDAKDVRNVLVSIIALLIPVYFQTVTGYISSLVVDVFVNISTMFTNSLYRSASGDPAAVAISMVFCMVFALPVMLMTTNRIITHRPPEKEGALWRFIRSRSPSVLISFLGLLLIFVIILTIVSITTIVFPVQIYVEFHKKVDSMASFISQQERNDLISKWALMSNKKDYDVIINEISDIAESHKFALPHEF
jgi:hypothetical protein